MMRTAISPRLAMSTRRMRDVTGEAPERDALLGLSVIRRDPGRGPLVEERAHPGLSFFAGAVRGNGLGRQRGDIPGMPPRDLLDQRLCRCHGVRRGGRQLFHISVYSRIQLRLGHDGMDETDFI